jgi:hypothetical protein
MSVLHLSDTRVLYNTLSNPSINPKPQGVEMDNPSKRAKSPPSRRLARDVEEPENGRGKWNEDRSRKNPLSSAKLNLIVMSRLTSRNFTDQPSAPPAVPAVQSTALEFLHFSGVRYREICAIFDAHNVWLCIRARLLVVP